MSVMYLNLIVYHNSQLLSCILWMFKIQYPFSMATTSQGILGAFKGKVGPVTGYVRNGQNILRSGTSTVKYKPTALRTAQLEKIKLCNHFTKAFTGTGFFNKSFPAYGSTGNGYNRATRALLNQALSGAYPNTHILYPQVLISKGKLAPAEHAAAAPMLDGKIYFSFTDNSETGTASSTDKIILVAYAEALQQAVFSLTAGFRKDCEAVLTTAAFKGYAVETWIGFLSDDETNASDSVYTGRIQL